MIDILHGDHVAFRYTERPALDHMMESAKARLLDGSTPVDGTPVVCGTCGKVVDGVGLIPDGGFA